MYSLDKYWLYIVFSIALMPGISIAKSDEQIIAEGIIEQSAKIYVDSLADEYIKEVINDLIPKEVLKNNPTIGSDILTGYSLISNVEKYNQMENGDYKALQGANALADGVMLYNPAIGGILKGALFIVGIFMSGIDASHQKQMLKIKTDTFKETTELIQLVRQLSTAEIGYIQGKMYSALNVLSYVNKLNNKMSNECNLKNESNEFVLSDKCLMDFTKIIVYKKLLIFILEDVVNYPLEYIRLGEILSQFNYLDDELTDLIRDSKYQLDQQLMILKSVWSDFASERFKKDVELVMQQSSLSRVEVAVNICEQTLLMATKESVYIQMFEINESYNQRSDEISNVYYNFISPEFIQCQSVLENNQDVKDNGGLLTLFREEKQRITNLYFEQLNAAGGVNAY